MLVTSLAWSSSLLIFSLSYYNSWLNYQIFIFHLFFFHRHSIWFFKFAYLLIGFSTVSFGFFCNMIPTFLYSLDDSSNSWSLNGSVTAVSCSCSERLFFPWTLSVGLFWGLGWSDSREDFCFLLPNLLRWHQPRSTLSYPPKSFQTTLLAHI